MILKLYFQLEFIFFKLVSLFSLNVGNSIAVVRVDAIGDYILFRNFLKEIKSDPKYINKKLILVGNQAWKEIALELDSKIVDKFIWINRSKIWSDKSYRYWTFLKICCQKYDIVINPTYSRELHFSDSIVRIMSAQRKIGFIGDLTNATQGFEKFADSFYDELISSPSLVKFEFERNIDFFSYFLKKELHTNTHIELEVSEIANSKHFSEYIVLFVGGSAKSKRWSNQNFIKLSEWIHEEFNTKIIFCGTLSDLDLPSNINSFEKEYSLNLIGKTPSILQLFPILNGARCVISNETAVPHICVALEVPVFVISHIYGRFTPYPKTLTDKYYPIFHPVILSSQYTDSELRMKYGSKSNLEINDITVQYVIENIMKPLSEIIKS